MDIASVLQMKAGLEIIEDQIQTLRQILAGLAIKYRDTPMAGRTHLQHALPITFGYKVAVFLSSFDRHYERLQQLKPRTLMVQFGGAAGTLASLGESDTGLKIRAQLASDLGLSDPYISWHVARDGVAEIVSFLSVSLRCWRCQLTSIARRWYTWQDCSGHDYHVFQRVLRG
jgi:3-carboxy-cis,cis-muconate cycloisomerase